MNMKQLVVKLLDSGHLSLADLVLDLDNVGVKYNDLFGFKPEIEVLEKLQEELAQ
jgi:hypothetical protein